MTNTTHNSFYVFIFIFNSLHVSSTSCSSSGETNCVNTTSGSVHSVSVAVSCAGRKTKTTFIVCLGWPRKITDSCQNCPYSVDIKTRSIPNASQTRYLWVNCCNSFNTFLWEWRTGAAVLTKFCVGGDEIYEFSGFAFLEEKLFVPYSGTKVSQ